MHAAIATILFPPRRPNGTAASARAVEKCSESARLQGERRDPAPSRNPRPRHLTVELVCQAETDARDPFRDSPRLVPVFVTQLLGQAMAPECAPTAAAAYDRRGETPAILFDARV